MKSFTIYAAALVVVHATCSLALNHDESRVLYGRDVDGVSSLQRLRKRAGPSRLPSDRETVSEKRLNRRVVDETRNMKLLSRSGAELPSPLGDDVKTKGRAELVSPATPHGAPLGLDHRLPTEHFGGVPAIQQQKDQQLSSGTTNHRTANNKKENRPKLSLQIPSYKPPPPPHPSSSQHKQATNSNTHPPAIGAMLPKPAPPPGQNFKIPRKPVPNRDFHPTNAEPHFTIDAGTVHAAPRDSKPRGSSSQKLRRRTLGTLDLDDAAFDSRHYTIASLD
ncbi:hypothetical protein H0H93_016584 [Arthromyces matolae]|nr:hypothetical protein H0H93_016584 [Arthromyces matolae]